MSTKITTSRLREWYSERAKSGTTVAFEPLIISKWDETKQYSLVSRKELEEIVSASGRKFDRFLLALILDKTWDYAEDDTEETDNILFMPINVP